MENQDLLEKIISVSTEHFTRSAGPGGQNVNKVSTQVTLRIPLAELNLPEYQTQLVLNNLGNRINRNGELIIHCSKTRSQHTNRQLALEKAVELITLSLIRPKNRRPTRPTLASKNRRLQGKKNRSSTKNNRRTPPMD